MPLDLYIKIDIISMEFEIDYYEDSSGRFPVEEFLLKLKKTNKRLSAYALRGIEKLRNKIYHTEPLSKFLEPGLWELRIKSETDILRIIYTFRKGKVILLLHSFIKKQQKTPERELEMARKRLKQVKNKEKN
jgi:phage-related protein